MNYWLHKILTMKATQWFLLWFHSLLSCCDCVGAIAPIRTLLTTPRFQLPAAVSLLQATNPRPVDLSLGIFAISRLDSARVATALLLCNGFAFRFLDAFVLRKVLDVPDSEKHRSLARRIGRRFLTLGVAAVQLFFRASPPLTAIGTGGAVLLLDRVKRHHSAELDNSKAVLRGDRIVDVFRLHFYSILTWSGVLYPILPWAHVAVKAVGCGLGLLALKDIFIPDVSRRSESTALLCQASGYALAGLSTFVVVTASCATPGLSGIVNAMNALGYACIVNLYSMVCLFPAAGSAKANPLGTGAASRSSHRVKRALYAIWLLINGAIATRLASPGPM